MKIRRKGRVLRAYDVGFKKEVILYAEENGIKKANQRYGVSEANIKRWKRLKQQIFENAIYNKDKLRVRKPIDYTAIKIDKSLYRRTVKKKNLDSMPLMERLLKPNEIAQPQPLQPLQQPPPQQQKAQILKSQSLSPTKLKVTRQGPKIRTPTDQSPRLHPPAPPPPAEVTPVNEEMCLRWNSHHSNMQQAFPNILNKEQYVDCTLAAEGKTLKCHRMILSSCSPYFEEILSNISPLQHPVLFMKDIPFWILKSLCDFMYAGEVHIYQNRLQELLTVAEMLKIKGLAGKTSNDQESRDNNRGNNDNHGNIKEERRQKKFNYQQHQQQSQQHQQFRTGRLINIPPLSRRNDYDNDDVLDPLDLLEPLYEEIADEKKPATTITPATTSATPTTTPNLLPKLQKYQQQFFKKQLPKRMKKRKFSEDRDPSPPPVFSFRKGTRSRPNVKIPKYYHSDYANSKPSTSSQSQSQQPPPPLPPPVPPQQSADPLLDVDDIKTEPIDVEDNNLSDYNDDTTSTTTTTQLPQSSGILPESLPSCIEISPQFNNNHNNNNDKFRKIKLTKPIISNVHSIDDHHNNNDNNNNNNNDVDEDDDDDLQTPLGGLEVIKITMEGNQERINLAVNDLNDVINDIDDDEDDDIDDNDGDDENSKTPPQLTTQSQINNDDDNHDNNDHDNNDTIDMDLEPVQQLENCDNEEISSQQLETNDNDHNHTIEENYEVKDHDHDQAIEQNYEIKNHDHNHVVENENDTKNDEIIEESPIIHDSVTDVITEQSHDDNDVIDHIIDDINDQTNNNNDDDDA